MNILNFLKKKQAETSTPITNNVVNYVSSEVSQVDDDTVLKLLTG